MDIQATQILEDEESLPYQTFNEKDELTQPIGALIINGRTHPIKVGINKIGRHPACDIVIDEQTISKYHAEIEASEGSSWICDLNSSNRSRLNNLILRPGRCYELKDGSNLEFGKVLAKYKIYPKIEEDFVPETPVQVKKIGKAAVIPGTPDSSINNSSTLDGDTSCVPASQYQEESSTFRRPLVPPPRNSLLNEASDASDPKLTEIQPISVGNRSEEGLENELNIFEMETQPPEDIHEMETQRICVNQTRQSQGELERGRSSDIQQLETQISDLENRATGKVEDKKIPKETMRRFSTREKSSRIRKRSLNEKIEDSEPKIRKTDDVPVRQTRMTSKSNILNYLTKNKSRKILEKDTTDELTSDNVSTNILGPSLKSKKEDISLNVPMRTRRSRLKDQDSSSDEKTDVREEEISSHCSMKTRSRLKAQNSLTDEEIDTKKDEVTSNPSINIRKTRSMNKNVEPSTELNEESQEIQIIMQNSSLEMKIKTAEDKQEDKNGRNFKRIGKNDVKISPNKFFQSEASFEMPKSRPSRSKGVKNTKIKVEDEDVLGETSRKTRAGERSRVSSTDRENFDVSDRVNRQLKSSGGKKTLKVGFEGEGTSSEVEESTSSGFESSVDTTSTTIGRSRSGRNTSSSFLNTFSPSKIKHKVLFTGVADGTYKKILSKLGGTKIEDPMKCTVLVTDKVRRTVKFLCCLALSVPIVSIDWLLESEKSGSFLDLESYILEDPAAEAKFKFRLKDSLDKAKRQKLLEGYMVVLTPNVPPPPLQELKSIVISCGGKVSTRPPISWPNKTVIVSRDEDISNARKFLAKAPKTVTVQSTEFILTGILRQELDFVSYKLI